MTRINDTTLVAYIVSQAVTSSGIYPVGHPARAVALAELGKLLLIPVSQPSSGRSIKETTEEEEDVDAWIESEASIVPIGLRLDVQLPAEPGRRLVWAREIILQALEESRIGYGRRGGLVGRELEGLAEGVGRELGVLRVQGMS